MPRVPGHRLRQSLPRRWIADLMSVSRGLPIISFERRMHLGAVAEARTSRRISWSLLFVKAYGIVSARRPVLRRALVNFPWPHFYEAHTTIATLALEREFRGESAVFFATIPEPHTKSLAELQALLDHAKTAPVETIPEFRRMIAYSKVPWPLRTLCWRYAYGFAGSIRAFNFGTFGLSSTAASGSTALNLISPVATTLNYGPLDAAHSLDVRLHFDHHVLDGLEAASVLAELEEVLNTIIVQELLANP